MLYTLKLQKMQKWNKNLNPKTISQYLLHLSLILCSWI